MAARPPGTPTRSPGRAFRPVEQTTLTPGTSRTLVSAQLPIRAFAADADLRTRLQTGRSALLAAERLLVSSKADRRRTHDAELAQLQEEGRRLDKERAQLEQQARAIQMQLDRERKEVDEAQKTIKSLESRQAGMKNQLAALDADEAELREEALIRQKAHATQREQLAKQAAQNAPELAYLSDQLGLTIKSRAYDRVVFTFTRIDPSAPKRAYSFEVDVSQQQYAVPACSPALPALQALIAQLNADRDFYAFVIAMRSAFVDSLGGR